MKNGVYEEFQDVDIMSLYFNKFMNITEEIKAFIENETRSCFMDFGCITPLYIYRMWNGSVPLEEIERALSEIKFPGR